MVLPAGINSLVQKVAGLSDVHQVLLFGSRGRGDGSERADFDLAVDAPNLSEADWNKIYWMAEDAETLYKIDCVWLQKADAKFKENILRDAKVLFKR